MIYGVRQFTRKILICGLAFSLAACSTNTPQEKRVLGAAVGGAAGAALGASSGASPGPITLTGIGAIIGLLIGSSFGNGMENSDKEKAYDTIAAGKTRTWQNPNSKVSYTIIPASHYITVDGNPCCRQFTAIQTTAEGKPRKIYRTACKGARGNWQLAS